MPNLDSYIIFARCVLNIDICNKVDIIHLFEIFILTSINVQWMFQSQHTCSFRGTQRERRTYSFVWNVIKNPFLWSVCHLKSPPPQNCVDFQVKHVFKSTSRAPKSIVSCVHFYCILSILTPVTVDFMRCSVVGVDLHCEPEVHLQRY